ncbi:MAG TPA: hypothetical protein VL550_00175 [Rhodocyclaceae bacterium]|nr:hypothetical protein [Rhodocyclaceae bacterium]
MDTKLPHFLLCCALLAVTGLCQAAGPGGLRSGVPAGMPEPAPMNGAPMGARNTGFSPQDLRPDLSRDRQQPNERANDPMSDADRRQLRRDVNDARDMYRRPRR